MLPLVAVMQARVGHAGDTAVAVGAPFAVYTMDLTVPKTCCAALSCAILRCAVLWRTLLLLIK